MQILFYHPDFDSARWVHSLEQAMPGTTVRIWQPGDNAPADFALVWHPPREMLAGRHNLKAVIALGAGVDSVLNQLKQDPILSRPMSRCIALKMPVWENKCRNSR